MSIEEPTTQPNPSLSAGTTPVQPPSDSLIQVGDLTHAQFHLGFERVKPELDGLTDKDLLQVNLEVPPAVQTALGVVPEVRAFWPQLQLLEPAGFQFALVTKLLDRALALGHTQLEYVSVTQPPDLPGKVELLLKGRSRLAAHAAPLVADGHLTQAEVSAHRSGLTHTALAYNVLGLTGLFFKSWGSFQSLVAIKKDELGDLRTLANETIQLLGLKEQGPKATAAALLRQKAFTLFIQSYTEARHGVAFLRRYDGDVDSIIPSLYAKKKKGSKPESDATSETDDVNENDHVDLDAAVATAFTERDQARPPTNAAARATEPLRELPPPNIAVGLPGSPPAFEGED